MFAANFKHIVIMITFRSKRLVIQTLLLIFVSANTFAHKNERFFQFGLFPPVSSNGICSGKTINAISFNLLGGYSAGNRIFELGGVWNVSRNYTGGLQIAGLLNYSGNSNYSAQISGLGNLSEQGKSLLQIGGLCNVADNVGCLQLSGLVNVARKVTGVQIGLINYVADGEEGVSIGLINVAKQGGKYEFEISFSETVNTVCSFRLGTDRFYTIFSGGINYFFSPIEYVLGLGFGTSISWNSHWSNQVEIQAFGFTLGKKFIKNSSTNVIQIRFPVCKEFGSYFKVFAGPVLNIGLQGIDVVETNRLTPWRMWSASGRNLQVSGWLGLSAGVRF